MAFNIIIDIFLIGILISGAAIGVMKGFVKIIAKPLKPILSLIIALSLAGTLSGIFIEPLVKEPVSNQVSGFLYENCDKLTPDNLEEELPSLVKIAAAVAGIDMKEIAEGKDDIIEALVDSLVGPIVHIVSVIISFVLLYIAAILLLSLAFAIINMVFNAGVFGIFNKGLGLVTSLLFAVFVVWGAVSIFEYVIHFPSIADSAFAADFTGGFVYNLFKQYNPIELLLSF